MKRFLKIHFLLVIFALLLHSCTSIDEQLHTAQPEATGEITTTHHPNFDPVEGVWTSPRDEFLEFSTVESFLEAHRLVQEGTADAELLRLAEINNFASLETLYVPTNIPEPYRLGQISVHEANVSLTFYIEEHLISEEAMRSATIRQQGFSFSLFRHESDEPMAGYRAPQGDFINRSREGDWIHDRYLFTRFGDTLIWAVGRNLATMSFPRRDAQGEVIGDLVRYFGLDSVEDLARFAELVAIDLT